MSRVAGVSRGHAGHPAPRCVGQVSVNFRASFRAPLAGRGEVRGERAGGRSRGPPGRGSGAAGCNVVPLLARAAPPAPVTPAAPGVDGRPASSGAACRPARGCSRPPLGDSEMMRWAAPVTCRRARCTGGWAGRAALGGGGGSWDKAVEQ